MNWNGYERLNGIIQDPITVFIWSERVNNKEAQADPWDQINTEPVQ
jgi:hypothetical protein